VPRYELLVDGKARARVASDDELREWIARYRDEHAETDPDAVHIQIRSLSPWSWLTGGKLVARDPFLGGEPRTIAERMRRDER
jgi:phenylpyruvate tautomerase PptA (4-oxalocrotonate tautomerase family)